MALVRGSMATPALRRSGRLLNETSLKPQQQQRGRRQCYSSFAQCSLVLSSWKAKEENAELETLSKGLPSTGLVNVSSSTRFSRKTLEERQGTHNGKSLILLIQNPLVAIAVILGAGTCHCLEEVSIKLSAIRSAGGLGVCIATKPFTFEGQRRVGKAEEALLSLRAVADFLFVIEHDMFLKKENITVAEASRLSSDTIILAVETILQLVSNRLDVDSSGEFCSSDVMRRLSGSGAVRHGRSYSVADAVQQAVSVFPLTEADRKALVVCALGKSTRTSNEEVQSAVALLRAQLGPEATIICLPVQDTALDMALCQAIILIARSDNAILPAAASSTVLTKQGSETSVDVSTRDNVPEVINENQSMPRRAFKGRESTSTNDKASHCWESGPISAAAKSWAKARAAARGKEELKPVFLRQRLRDDDASQEYAEVQGNNARTSEPLPYDPAAIPDNNVLKMSIEVLLHACKSASEMMYSKDHKIQQSLSQRAAFMLEKERTSRSLPRSVEMDFASDSIKGQCEDGKGRLTYADGSCYDGHWAQGKRNGHGTFYFANGDVYEGFWRDNVMHGKGWLYFHTGDRLQAEFVQGKAHGAGHYYFADGSILFGQFQDNWRHGECTFCDSAGSRWREIWNTGVLVSRHHMN